MRCLRPSEPLEPAAFGRAFSSAGEFAVAYKQGHSTTHEHHPRQGKRRGLHMPEQHDHEPHKRDGRQATRKLAQCVSGGAALQSACQPQ